MYAAVFLLLLTAMAGCQKTSELPDAPADNAPHTEPGNDEEILHEPSDPIDIRDVVEVFDVFILTPSYSGGPDEKTAIANLNKFDGVFSAKVEYDYYYEVGLQFPKIVKGDDWQEYVIGIIEHYTGDGMNDEENEDFIAALQKAEEEPGKRVYMSSFSNTQVSISVQVDEANIYILFT